MPQSLYSLPAVGAERAAQGKRYLEFLRVPALSAGVYVLAAGAEDPQQPHQEDEIYYVLRGRARMKVGPPGLNSDDFAVAPGQLIFVPARAEHRFHSITEELELLVVFGPAETS